MKTAIVMIVAALAAGQLTGCGGDKTDSAADTAGSSADTSTQDTSAQDTGADKIGRAHV